ncbi:MAG: hypothetical protein KC516_02245 [Nanoarchaeota archaeon]|nr:hypothetical protein [Nanoarchaeota archaeon]
MEIATGYAKLAINLHEHMSNYKPGKWIVPISDVHPTPFVLEKEAQKLIEGHKNNSLDAALEEMSSEYKPWFIKEAVKNYFSTQDISEIIKEESNKNGKK